MLSNSMQLTSFQKSEILGICWNIFHMISSFPPDLQLSPHFGSIGWHVDYINYLEDFYNRLKYRIK